MKTNHQRGFKEKPTRYVGKSRNGDTKQGYTHFRQRSTLTGEVVSATAKVHDTVNGKHGVARNIRGAKKFIRSRIRVRENRETRRLLQEALDE